MNNLNFKTQTQMPNPLQMNRNQMGNQFSFPNINFINPNNLLYKSTQQAMLNYSQNVGGTVDANVLSQNYFMLLQMAALKNKNKQAFDINNGFNYGFNQNLKNNDENEKENEKETNKSN